MLTRNRLGQVIDGRYEIVEYLGRGAMAEVFRAHDRRRDRAVALKILHRDLVQNAEAMQRFQREARAQEMIQHRNVAALHGGGVTASQEPYLVVELLQGRSLRTVLRDERRVALGRAVDYCSQALEGLAAIHTLGIYHRDLKPANVMLETEGSGAERVVLIDFGFALLEGSSKLTLQGHVVGSLSYMAPERLAGKPSDERSDVYAMGIILYELLVGRPPFMAEDDYQLIHAHLAEEPVLPSVAAPQCGVTPELERVLLRALRKNPDERPQSAAQMNRELQQALAAHGQRASFAPFREGDPGG